MSESTVQTGPFPRALAALVGSAIAVAILGVLLHTPRFNPADQTPNPLGAVRIGLYGQSGKPLHKGDTLRPNDAVIVTYDHPHFDTVHIALFAVDTNGAAHWIAPPDRPAHRETQSMGLPTTVGEHQLIPATSIGDVPPGPLTFVALLNPGVMSIDLINGLSPEERTPSGLRDHFPDGVVLTWPVQVVAPTL